MLRVTQFEPRVLSWWRTHRGKIDMSPSYQRRGRLWSRTDKQFLIDTILNDYDVPKLYIADFTLGNTQLNSKQLPYAIIDGKQRFEAVLDFYDGKVVLADDFTLDEDSNLSLGGLGYNDLKSNHPYVAEKFDNFHFSVMRVLADSEEPIKELFVRLNRSKPLTGAELRNAMSGKVPELVRTLASSDFFTNCTSFGSNRGEDLNAAAKILMFEYYGELRETKKASLDRFAESSEVAADSNKLEVAARRVTEILEVMSELFLPRDAVLKSAGIVPVYYWLVRSVNSTNWTAIREFLVAFAKLRGEIRRGKSADNFVVDPDKVREFDELSRSANDSASHRGRYSILESAFRSYLELPLL